MNLIDKVKVIINRTYTSSTLKKHEDDFYCNKFWCHKGKLVTVELCEIENNIKSIKFNNTQRKIEYDILERGYDYNMGYIVVNKHNKIMDGYHRFLILKRHFNDSHQITVLKLSKVGNIFPIFLIKMSIIFIITKMCSALFRKKNKVRVIELDI